MNAALPHLRVLVVEDEGLIRWSIAETLAERGHTVLEAASAAAALQALEAPGAIDVVLLDCRLPDSEGLSLLAAVRRLRPDAGVVMMTAFGTPEVAEGALSFGAHRIVSKPFDMSALESLVLDAHRYRRFPSSPTH
jgi:DNA-binding NtrC family response regulator